MNTTQLEFTAQGGGVSQCEAILKRLEAERGLWVGLMELMRVSGSVAVHSRINDLRGRGLVIAHKNEWVERHCHSFYMLCDTEACRVEVPEPKEAA